MIFSVDMNVDFGTGENTGISINYNLITTYNNIGKPVSVRVPEDADEYTDITSQTDSSGLSA